MATSQAMPQVQAPFGGTPDRLAGGVLLAGLAALALPTLWDFSFGAWASQAQGHELVFAAVSMFLLYQRRARLFGAAPARRAVPIALFIAGLLLYVVGRSQQFLRVEIVSLLWVAASVLWLNGGRQALRAAAFPLFFLLFIVPLPYSLVLAVTGPLKLAVSAVATQFLQWTGFPVGRSGVVVTIGQYQLLVSEACAGLQTMFTLEAMGLLYASLRSGGSSLVNAVLAVMVVPVSFAANVVRVIVLMLVTYWFGDAVGQGFVHGFAGLVLFSAALLMIFCVDWLLQRALQRRKGRV
ncbi:MAG: exosortase B [Pseudomonadota bacterium]